MNISLEKIDPQYGTTQEVLYRCYDAGNRLGNVWLRSF